MIRSGKPIVPPLTYYVPTTRTITIDGVTYDLSANRSWTTSGSISGNYVPYTGATANVDLGEYEIKVGQISLDTSPTGIASVGTTRWNDTIGSIETTLKGGSVVLKNGVDLVARVVNKVTPNTTLTKAAYPVVKVSGAQGQRLAVEYAQGNIDNNSADTLGVVIETIPTNQEGFIMTVGTLEDINTTGSLQGENWNDGDVLYLSPTIPGGITKVKPTGLTGHIVVIGYVEYAHQNNGKIYVKIMNGWELDELHNVYINTATLVDNDALVYESSSQLWKNKNILTATGLGDLIDYSTTSTVVGWSSFTNKQIYYRKIGKQIFCNFLLAGTSNSTDVTFTLPDSNNANVTAQTLSVQIVNNGAISNTPGRVITNLSSNVVTVNRDRSQTAFTNTGTKTVSGQFFYFTD